MIHGKTHFIAGLMLLALLLAPPASNAASVTAHVSDANGAPLRDAVVYIIPVSGKPAAHGPRTAVIDQVDRMFVPLVSVVETGTAVTFPNKDNIRHSVYSFSPAKTFTLKLYSGVPAEPVVFDKSGLVVMGCNIHDQMIAFLQVVDTPWFGKSAADGMTRIELPSGDYEIHVWHYRQAGADVVRRLEIQNDAMTSVSLDLKPQGADGMHP